jgi:hypothetical protein
MPARSFVAEGSAASSNTHTHTYAALTCCCDLPTDASTSFTAISWVDGPGRSAHSPQPTSTQLLPSRWSAGAAVWEIKQLKKRHGYAKRKSLRPVWKLRLPCELTLNFTLAPAFELAP